MKPPVNLLCQQQFPNHFMNCPDSAASYPLTSGGQFVSAIHITKHWAVKVETDRLLQSVLHFLLSSSEFEAYFTFSLESLLVRLFCFVLNSL